MTTNTLFPAGQRLIEAVTRLSQAEAEVSVAESKAEGVRRWAATVRSRFRPSDSSEAVDVPTNSAPASYSAQKAAETPDARVARCRLDVKQAQTDLVLEHVSRGDLVSMHERNETIQNLIAHLGVYLEPLLKDLQPDAARQSAIFRMLRDSTSCHSGFGRKSAPSDTPTRVVVRSGSFDVDGRMYPASLSPGSMIAEALRGAAREFDRWDTNTVT